MNTLATLVEALKCKDITFPDVLWDVLWNLPEVFQTIAAYLL
jgi:hypothetical protein